MRTTDGVERASAYQLVAIQPLRRERNSSSRLRLGPDGLVSNCNADQQPHFRSVLTVGPLGGAGFPRDHVERMKSADLNERAPARSPNHMHFDAFRDVSLQKHIFIRPIIRLSNRFPFPCPPVPGLVPARSVPQLPPGCPPPPQPEKSITRPIDVKKSR